MRADDAMTMVMSGGDPDEPVGAPENATGNGKGDAASPRAARSIRARGPRSVARLAAVQALYQMEIAQTDLNVVIEEFQRFRFDGDESGGTRLYAEADRAFFVELLRGVVQRQRDIDPVIDRQLAAGWRLARIDAILRAILRSATVELMHHTDVPVAVVINEYIEIAREFFDDEEPKVVNGVLDQLARRVRAE